MKKVLITGITGFAGSFLAEHLLERGGFEIAGTYLSSSSLSSVSLIKDKINSIQIDLNNESSVNDVVSKQSPEYIFHLAALTSPSESFENPSDFIINNIRAQINLLEAVRHTKLSPRILIVSSAEVYGNVSSRDLPIDEETSLAPVNPYAVSKIAQDFLGLQYFLSYKMQIVRVRPFNHIGPRQSPSFVVSSFAKKIAEIEKGKIEPVLKVGNLSAKRDFTDVRDIVRGYVSLLETADAGDVYNIGSGKSYPISEILNKLLSLSDKKIKVEVDEKLIRPIDVPELVCDNSKILKKTGWKPSAPIENTLKDTLDYWRALI